MKKSISFLLAIIMLLSAFPLTGFDNILPLPKANAAQEIKAEKIYFGDMNENGKHEAADARRILRYSVALDVFSDRQQEIADCNADGKITAADARIELRASVGLEKTAIFENNILTNAEFLTLLMVSAGYGACETEPYFKNVPATHKNFEGVQAAVDWNVLDKKNAFEPDKDATIGYALELAAKIKDVPSGAKLLSGTVDKKAALTKETAAKIAEKVKEYRLKDKNEKEFESVEIKDTVTTYNKNDAKAVDEDTFTIINDVPKAGDIFRAQTPDGEVARKVVSAKKNADGSYTVETVKPEMDEVFDDFSFVKTLSVNPAEVEFVPAANVYVVNDPTQPQLHMADSRKKVLLDETFMLNSSNNPNLTPKLCVKSTSDYIKALNNEYVCQVPNAKEALEKYNKLVKGPGANEKSVKTETIAKYESGWGILISLALSDVEIDFDFKDFWTDGDYEITLNADVDVNAEFNGKFDSTVKLGHFPVQLGLVDLIVDVDIDVYLYFSANGDIKLEGKGRISQSYGNYGGRPSSLNNNSFNATLEANLEAEGGIRVDPKVSSLGFELAAISLRLGVYGKASAKLSPLVEYKNQTYFYAGDFFKAPTELKQKFGVCVDFQCSFPIIAVTVTAGEDLIKKIEKLKKKNPEIFFLPTTYTFNICTTDNNSLLEPKTAEMHLENTTSGIKKVSECENMKYNTIAHKFTGFAVDEKTDKPLSGAMVEFIDFADNVVATSTTNATGDFELKFIPFGKYKMNFYKDGLNMPVTGSFVVEKNETNVGKIKVDTFNEAAIYTKYLKDGGYENFNAYSMNKKYTSYFKVESCLADINNDEIAELLITIMNTKYPGPRGYHTNDALLTIKDGKVEILLMAESSGGTMGGDSLSLRYDKNNNRYVVLYNSVGRDGVWANVSITDIYNGTNKFSSSVKQLKTEGYNLESDIYKTYISKVKNETSLYYHEDNYFRYYQIDGKYVPKNSYNDLYNSFVVPSDEKYQQKTVTLEKPCG